jgi:uncharacterized oxidoreductase
MTFPCKCCFITGGGSGIGRGLAVALARQGTRVIIAGRRVETLREVCKANRGVEAYSLDITDRSALERAAKEVPEKFGAVDCLINNAGVQRKHDLTKPTPLDFCDLEIDTNLRSLMSCTAAFLPHLLAQPSARIVNITSGLAYVPYAVMPVYCATKSALRSFTLSLRHQLKATSVRVIEVSPPAVSTELHDYMGPKGRDIGIPLEAFVREAMEGLNSGSEEIHVGDAKGLFANPVESFARLNALAF